MLRCVKKYASFLVDSCVLTLSRMWYLKGTLFSLSPSLARTCGGYRPWCRFAGCFLFFCSASSLLLVCVPITSHVYGVRRSSTCSMYCSTAAVNLLFVHNHTGTARIHFVVSNEIPRTCPANARAGETGESFQQPKHSITATGMLWAALTFSGGLCIYQVHTRPPATN